MSAEYRYFHVAYLWATGHGHGHGDIVMRSENTKTSRAVINNWRRIIAETMDDRVSAHHVSIVSWQEYESSDGWEKRT